MTFWGGAVDPQHVLAYKSPREVREYAINAVKVFKKDGGFIFTQPHNIQAGVPAENIIALFEAGNQQAAYQLFLNIKEQQYGYDGNLSEYGSKKEDL